MGNPRYIKVAEQMKVIIAELLERRIKDPRLGFVTLTDVRLTGDGREATVFYTVLGDETERAASAAALKSANGMIRSTVGKQLGMKFTPTIAFVLDAVPETAAEMDALLAAARASDADLAARYRAAHEAYLADRAPLGDVPEIAGISAGGMPTRVKCLHVLVGHALAAGPGVNPFGDEALALIGDVCPAGGPADAVPGGEDDDASEGER